MEDTKHTPAPLLFVVTHGDSRLGLRPGHCLEWNPAAPKGKRLTLRQSLEAAESDLDRMMLRGGCVPVGVTILEARQRLVARVVADHVAEAAA